jgi:L-ascorbate metabolism protein UlaG (beta-lactamase superfamily)
MDNITWLGHASFMLKGEKTVYIDPFKIQAGQPADIILITHGHYDHCSAEDVRKITKKDTVIIGPPDCACATRHLSPGEKLSIGPIVIEAVPAYNLKKDFHPKFNHWVGYIVTIGGKRIYHAGDTDFIPEMRDFKDIDIALLPVGGTYTMTAEEAADAANSFKPKIAVPMHYGKIVGSRSDADMFRQLFKGKTELLN